MTQTSNRFFDEIGRLMNDAAGAAQGVKREVDTVVRNQAEKILSDLDIVKREEFEAVKDMARLAREENEALKARIAVLEAKLGVSAAAPDAGGASRRAVRSEARRSNCHSGAMRQHRTRNLEHSGFVLRTPRNDLRSEPDDGQCHDMISRSRGAIRPRFAINVTPSQSEGAGKAGCALHPRSRVQTALSKKRTRAYRSSGNIRLSLRSGFTAYTCSPR